MIYNLKLTLSKHHGNFLEHLHTQFLNLTVSLAFRELSIQEGGLFD